MANTVALSGKSGTLTGDGACGATEIKNWKVSVKIAALDATSMASAGWEEFIVGLMGASGSFTAIGVSPLAGAIAQTVAATISLKTNTAGITVSGKCIVETAEVGADVGGVVSYDCTFKFTGVVSVA